MVNHGLLSMTMFLLAGMVERRTSTGELSLLGGMARGRPALATILMTVGVMALAVPLSSNFAGEFLILAGVFQQGWGWAVVGAVAIVLAAMYMLRLISAVLHEDVGPSVDDAALDLRVGELAVVVPLVLILLVLSAWPNAISGHSFGAGSGSVPTTLHGAGGARDPKPHVDWFALSPSLSMLAAAGLADARRGLLAEALAPRGLGGRLRGRVRRRRSSSRSSSTTRARTAAAIIADSIFRDRWAATAQVIIAACGLLAVLVAYRERMREENIAEYYVLLAAAGAGMAFFVQAASLITLFLGLEWFSIALYVLCAIDIDLVGSLEAGLKYLVIGAVGSATLLFGSALVYGATGELEFDKIAAAGHTHNSLLVLGLAMMLAGFAFKASAAPFHMWTPDAYQGAPTPVTAFMSSATKVAALVVMERVLVTAFPREAHLWTWAVVGIAIFSLAIGNIAALAQRNVKRLLAYSSVSHAGFMLIAVGTANRGRRAGAHVLPDPLLRDVARRVRRDRGARARARGARDPREPVRLRLGAAVLRRLDVGVHARLPRLPADRRLLGEDLRLLCRLRHGLVVADRDRRRLHRRVGRLLPRGRPLDVPARQRRAAARARRRLAAARARAPERRRVCVVVTVGSFFFVQPLIDVAAAARGRYRSDPVTVGLERPAFRTPRSAGYAGIVFSLLLLSSLLATHFALPQHPGNSKELLTTSPSRELLLAGLSLIPFAAIAFLWFIGVLRDRIGEREDRFFSTVFFGSGLLFVAVLHVTEAMATSIVLSTHASDTQTLTAAPPTGGRPHATSRSRWSRPRCRWPASSPPQQRRCCSGRRPPPAGSASPEPSSPPC